MATFCINGKFLAQRTTGVQRVAMQLVQALDALLHVEPGAHRWLLLHPRAAEAPSLRVIEPRAVGPARIALHAWEQGVLPVARGALARDALLVSLAGSAPLAAGRQWLTIHDAAVWEQAGAYSAPFVHWYRTLFTTQARRGAGLITVSADARARLARHLRVESARIHVVPNGADHLRTVAADESVLDAHGLRGRPFLLAVGTAGAHKNTARLVQAFARLEGRPALALVIVGARGGGGFAARPQGEGAAAARVVHTGPLTDGPLKALYRHAAALVFPSLYEGFGIPPLEAMGEGCPVVASRATAVPEVCGEAALYVDPLQVDDIACGLARVLDDAVLRQGLVAAGAAQSARWRWSGSAAVLRGVLEGDPRVAPRREVPA